MTSRDWTDAVVLVTGASRGIGHALTLLLAARGAHVWALARDASTIPSDDNGRIHARACDVRDEAAVSALFDEIERTHDSLDLLVNNASILGPTGPIEQLDYHHWQETMRINVDGVFLVSRHAIPLMRRGKRPMMINLSSSVGRAARAEWGAYCVSKFGVEALTGILAAELLEDHITSVSLNPGGTATDMRASAYPDEDPSTLPDAMTVARTVALLAERLGHDATGRRYSSRSLFEFLDGEGSVEHLPHDGGEG